MRIDSVKQKLCFHCGTLPSAMALQLKDEQGKLLAVLDDDSKMLGFYSPYDGCVRAGGGSRTWGAGWGCALVWQAG